MKRDTTIIILFIVAFIPVRGEPSGIVIGLGDAENIAVDNSLDLRLMSLQGASLEQAEKAKLRDFFPQVSVSYRQNRSIAQRDYDNGNHSVQLQVTQPIYDGGRSKLNYDIARIDLRLLSEKKKQTVNEIRFQARQQYLKLQQQRLSIAVATANLENLFRLRNKSEAEYQIGEITALDITEIRNQYNQKQLDLSKEKNSFQDAMEDFALFLRLPEGSLPTLRTLDLANINVSDKPLNIDNLIDIAFQNRPDIKQAVIDHLKSERQLIVAERHYLPNLSLTGHYGKTGTEWPPQTIEWGVGLNITIPLYGSTIQSDSTVNHSRADTERSVSSGGSIDIYNNPAWSDPVIRGTIDALQAKDKLRLLRKQTELQVRRLVRDFEERRKALELADQSLAVRENRYLIELKKYETGETSLTDLLTEQVKLIQARQDLIRERVDFAISANQLEIELGLDIDSLALLKFSEYSSDDSDAIRRSWTPRTTIQIPEPNLR